MAGKTTQETFELLDKALAHVHSVDYKVSVRWVAYRLLQDGTFKSKKEFSKLGNLNKYRKRFFRGWAPDTFIDDTRNIIYRGTGCFDKEEWIENLTCDLDKIQNQDYFLMIMFEAKAMSGQFKKYTENIPLIPSGGDASISFKYAISKDIEWASKRYGKPIVILYFGDCDKKGEQIPQSALKDIRNWCSVNFKFIHCGLTEEQALKFKLPENPDKLGDYQWEALSDEQAREIIEKNVKKYQKKSRFKEIEEKEKKILEGIKLNLKEKKK